MNNNIVRNLREKEITVPEIRKKQTDAERRKIASEFQSLHQFLEEQEQLLLARLGDLDRQIARRHKEHATKLAGEISLLNVLISDTERKCQQPATEFLQV
ncbi:hypothetical protein Y1Q_0019054 [Alligator mississippiensis]|uniref:Uncharacterized protein n=1 Tax=Alligator mississippiensis TaxID=8496 RepID=A0A151MYY6_ALLMI|nr:hypothetical protein Y1Q_0019054 [Alligator mississippiensis]